MFYVLCVTCGDSQKFDIFSVVKECCLTSLWSYYSKDILLYLASVEKQIQ